MSKKTLLSESQIRRFMKLANQQPLAAGYIGRGRAAGIISEQDEDMGEPEGLSAEDADPVGPDMMGADDLGGEEAAGDAGGGDEGGADTALLAAPGNRDENGTVQKYTTKDGKVVKNGRRQTKPTAHNHKKRSSRTRSTDAVTSSFKGKTAKSMFPGMSELEGVANTVYGEAKKEFYDNEEQQLFSISQDMKMLIESMELKKDEA